jgi:uncharacterized membrane protein YdjX (TVP38/TMEM64 family)/Fe-S oxidoreductase
MASPNHLRDISSVEETPSPLEVELKRISEDCIGCDACQKKCEFLKKYGKPKEIAEVYDPSDKAFQAMPFGCSLCQLCASVCSEKINPAAMFLEMRREKVRLRQGDYPEHAGMLAFERRGTSQRYTYYAIPAGCDRVFFPGCALSGSRPDKTFRLYEHMKKSIPTLGVVLDCCMKISHDLGRERHFTTTFQEMKNFLLGNGVRNVIVACPNCHRMFKEHGGKLSVKTAYEIVARNGFPRTEPIKDVITVHDPCAVRFEKDAHSAVRHLVANQGLTIEEMPHHEERTLCCGEGGFVGCISPDLAKAWGTAITGEADGRRIITYCAGCTNHLNAIAPTSHILDLLFEPKATLAGKVKVSKAPVTYLNRLRLKSRFRKSIDARVTRERTFTAGEETKKGGMVKRLLLLFAIVAVILAVRFTGATQYLQQESLRQWIQSYGTLAPIIYMLIYTIAPALLLPGLPITIVGGILFGPFWGVVYTITSATLGACVAFLVARYIARDWVEGKLISPRWQRLDQGVKDHGWKVVAFTRLIPLFPFNLLNYAFGLTKIKFLHYAFTTLICMLPACIAFIVFSSSLLDVIRGKISSAFIAGLGLIILVSLIPLFYRRYKAKKGITDPL